MGSILLTADWHWTDKARDRYRFGLVDWIANRSHEWDLDGIVIAGDLTDSKDRHSAWLVNEVCMRIEQLTALCPVAIVRGNHDCVDEGYAFFSFLSRFPHVSFVNDAALLTFGETSVVAVAHHRDGNQAVKKAIQYGRSARRPGLVVMHQTLAGAKASSGHVLDGLDPSAFRAIRFQVWSGDVHVPQTIGSVQYIGAPYSIRFDDSFEPRVVVWRDGRHRSETFHTIRKMTLYVDDENGFAVEDGIVQDGDQVKVRVKLPRHRYVEWPVIRQRIVEQLAERNAEVFGVEALRDDASSSRLDDLHQKSKRMEWRDTFNLYCERERVSAELREIGEEVVREHAVS